ncbi:hypothetical protein H2201_006942 [Coniosporium apollinis]|uniref:SnoaL-like domain-containing protein n=2 Tax=Coniosporium TaxID=2810619 RepID=A0ABQ9NM45_9PEZI|nr:hypothetical protein H2199_005343 [Cladosporium sp. JES 115]KAJ9660361.1 hypothetical protein H2201_006942 [Coniosporium apollinis]
MSTATELQELRALLRRCLDALDVNNLMCCRFLVEEYYAYDNIPGYRHVEPGQKVHIADFARSYRETGLYLKRVLAGDVFMVDDQMRMARDDIGPESLDEKYVRILLVFLSEGKVELPDGTVFCGLESNS